MARPIWSGTLTFGLLNIPVSLLAGERRTDVSLKMLDSRDNTPIRYERVNAETGEEVPWKDIVKAFEYDKGNYVVLEPEDIKSAGPESHGAIEVEGFVDVTAIGPQYFEKPYVLQPAKKAEKGYVLLREALRKTGRIGIARVVIRTKEHLCAVMPQGDALLLMMMRYPQELVDIDEYRLPEGKGEDYRITAKEQKFSEQLIETMSGDWEPGEYRDEFRERLQEIIAKRIKGKKVVEHDEDAEDVAEDATTNVVDFMSLLQQSIDRNKRTPAKKSLPKSKDDGKAGKAGDSGAKAKAKSKAKSKAESKSDDGKGKDKKSTVKSSAGSSAESKKASKSKTPKSSAKKSSTKTSKTTTKANSDASEKAGKKKAA